MNILVIGISLIMVIASVVFAPKREPVIEKQQEVLSASPATTEESEPTPEAFFTTAPAAPAPTGNPDFQYPGSRTDDVDRITDWYKEKIKASGYNVTSFVTTKTNGQVLNKLVAAKSGEKIEVVITKEPGESLTQITVELDNAQ